MTGSLFERALSTKRAPLAERMRPRKLSEYIGQSHLLAPGQLLRRAIEADRVSSLILYGPPGTGKTTLAQVIAEHSKSTFVSINAVLSGVKVIREEIEAAQDRARRFAQSTLLFVDEIHRFNQAQQDALLPWVERGVVTLIGATTENPYFEVNNALNSRSHIFQLRPLSMAELKEVAFNALSDPRGYSDLKVDLREEALNHWVNVVDGDARSLLNALELAIETTEPQQGLITIDLSTAEASIQERAVLYDRDGDAHFDTMSAFIKSMRGSDADASLYWLAKMIYAGEPPRQIFRRLLIFASEDVGLAWSKGLSVVEACAAAFDRVGMPEGRFHLSQATLAMATAPKSNSTMGLFDALETVKNEARAEVPTHLKDANRDGETLGHGSGYLYPHAYQKHWVAQDYLPTSLRGKVFYHPSDQGEESLVATRVRALREAQLEGVISGGAGDPLLSDQERLSVSPHEERVNTWVERAMGDVSAELAMVREKLLHKAQIVRNDLILDLNAGGGLFTWPALRATFEGGVWSCCWLNSEAEAMSAMARGLPWAHQPKVLSLEDLHRRAQTSQYPTISPLLTWVKEEGLQFNKILGRSVFNDQDHWGETLNSLCLFFEGTQGQVCLAEPYIFASQRLSELVLGQDHCLDVGRKAMLEKWSELETVVYLDTASHWERDQLESILSASPKISQLKLTEISCERRVRLTSQRVEQWLSSSSDSYLSKLREEGLTEELAHLIANELRRLSGRQVSWRVSWLLISFKCGDLSF